MSKNCKYCEIIKGKRKRKGGIIFENKYAVVFLGNQHHKGHTIIALKKHIEDVLDLTEREREDFFDVVIKIAKAVKKAMKPDKLNYALFGNWVPHLHWHIYPRYKADDDWGDPPIFENNNSVSEKELEEIADAIRKKIK